LIIKVDAYLRKKVAYACAFFSAKEVTATTK